MLKPLFVAGACACLLSACASIGGGSDTVAQAALKNLEHCDRTYQATIGMGGGGSLTIKCPPKPFDVPAAPAQP